MYRVGNHQPQNLYRDDRYIGVMFDAENAALVVATLNVGAEALAAATTRDMLGELLIRADLDDDEDGPIMLARLRPLLNLSDEALAARRADYLPDEPAVEHHASSPGGDGLGYGPCTGCGELWPCKPSRGERP